MSLEVYLGEQDLDVPFDYTSQIPEVPYTSYEEFKALRSAVIEEYNHLIEELINVETTLNGLICLSAYGLDNRIKRLMLRKGVAVFLKLTKGEGVKWCEQTNTYLVLVVESAAQTYANCMLELLVTNSQDTLKKTCEYLQGRVKQFILHEDMCPYRYNYLFLTNFRQYSVKDSAYNENEIMPIAQIRQHLIAFAMGMHPRLGAQSVVAMLDEEMMRLLFYWRAF